MGGMRVARTRDGRYVPEAHPEAAFLAYTQHDELPEEVAEQLKAAKKPADKQLAKPADKVVDGPQRPPKSGPGSGIDAWRAHAAEATGESPEALAELSRDELIELVGG